MRLVSLTANQPTFHEVRFNKSGLLQFNQISQQLGLIRAQHYSNSNGMAMPLRVMKERLP